jgi:FKBP-type peptidyl-prolyl cis-trans isomerase (trigger factor)
LENGQLRHSAIRNYPSIEKTMTTTVETRSIYQDQPAKTTAIEIPDGLTQKEKNKLMQEERERVRNEELAIRRQSLQEYPFDPRTEVSADAKKIVQTLWIIFALLPVVFWILAGIILAANH